MKKVIILKWIIFSVALATNLFILVNSCLNGEASSVASSAIISGTADTINSIAPGTITNSNSEQFVALIRKLFGHFALFGFSGLVTTWAFYLFCKDTKFNIYYSFGALSFITGFGVAWFSELIQVFVPGRSGSVSDVLIDSIGYFIGVLLVIFILFLAKKPIFQNQIQQEKSAA